MKSKPLVPIAMLKDWWWLIGLVVSGIILWGNLPQRMAKAEQQIDDLKGWAKEVQGYTRATHELQQQQQMHRQPAPTTSVLRGLEQQDSAGVWWCCPLADEDACYDQSLWRWCE